MGQELSKTKVSQETRLQFIRQLLNDVEALELMLEKRLIESKITRIGAEQEFCLIDKNWRPANNAQDILPLLKDEHFTTELARYNLEINLDPFELKTDCFSQMQNQLESLLQKAQDVCKSANTNILLTGILPTITKSELMFDYMTQSPRYWAMNDVIKQARGEDITLKIRGIDELSIMHDSVLFEACNTSFQLHLQIDPNDFTASYNWSQAIAGPVLSVCANSPLLLGRELWSETRIALFQQSIDTRNASYALKDQEARVSFGNQWSSGTAADIFKNDLATHKVLLAREIEHDALDQLTRGEIPKLQALCLNNSTIYRWNRPCYGVGGGKPHLRIENRYIPSGPSVIDEMANFAYWIGLMVGRPTQFDDMESQMDFRDAKANFIKAARHGKESMLCWEGKSQNTRELTLNTFLPIAHNGLKKVGINQDDIDRLLGVIEARVSAKTGAQWITSQFRTLRKDMKRDEALVQLTRVMHANQQSGSPVHKWGTQQQVTSTHDATLVSHIMATNVFRVHNNDHADLATSIMAWKNIHHVPVENEAGELAGLLTWTHMKKHKAAQHTEVLLVEDIMAKTVISVPPNTEIKTAIQIMKQHEYGCLPVVHDNQLVGIITIKDVLPYDN